MRRTSGEGLCADIVCSVLEYLHVDGFREPRFDNTLFGRLVMKSSTKDLIKNLVHMYIRDSSEPHKRGQQMYKKISDVHRSEGPKKAETSWSPDFIDGKGEGLTILLHGRPGVGKTYTAGTLVIEISRDRF